MPYTIQVCTNSRRPAFCWKWTQRCVLLLLRLLHYFASLGDSEIPSPEILQAAVSSGFEVPEVAKRVRVRPSAGLSVSGTDGIRHHRPIVESADRPVPKAPFNGPQTVDVGSISANTKVVPAAAALEASKPQRRRRPLAKGKYLNSVF